MSKESPLRYGHPLALAAPYFYFKDAARAIVELGRTPLENIKSVNYLLAGIDPIASAGELADMVRTRIPAAQIDFLSEMRLHPRRYA